MLAGGAVPRVQARRVRAGAWVVRAAAVVLWLVVITMFVGVVVFSVANASGASGHLAAAGGAAWG